MKKTLIVGAFGFNSKNNDGQTVKTRELYYGLSEKLGNDEVDYLETVNWKRRPLKLLFDFFKKAKNSETIIMLPAQRGVLIFSRLLLISKRLFSNNIYYDVVGGWIPDKVSKNKRLLKILSNFDGIWVETNIMKDNLNGLGLNNVEVVRNFKRLNIVSLENENHNNNELRLCIFSRIMKEKGISDAINIVTELNKENNDSIYLDIYGMISSDYKEEFIELLDDGSKNIRYIGEVDSSKSVDTLKKYDALLFPTRFKTEGLPGTIIDAYASGIPVIAARWNSFEDIVIESKTGIGFKQFDLDDMKDKINWSLKHKEELYEMKKNCTVKAKEYLTETVIEEIVNKYLVK